MARILGCPTNCNCDVVIHSSDAERVKQRECVWVIDDVDFINRHIWIGGLPHITIEDLKKIQNREVTDMVKCILEKLRSGVRVA